MPDMSGFGSGDWRPWLAQYDRSRSTADTLVRGGHRNVGRIGSATLDA